MIEEFNGSFLIRAFLIERECVYIIGDVSMLVMCSYARTAQMIIFDVFLTQCFPVERKKKIAKSQNRLTLQLVTNG